MMMTEKIVRTFKLMRREDETGVSGKGHVADGAIFPDGITVLVWRTEISSIGVYQSLEDCRRIHGHGEKTIILPTAPSMTSHVNAWEEGNALAEQIRARAERIRVGIEAFRSQNLAEEKKERG
jgi:hypothetical protein